MSNFISQEEVNSADLYNLAEHIYYFCNWNK